MQIFQRCILSLFENALFILLLPVLRHLSVFMFTDFIFTDLIVH